MWYTEEEINMNSVSIADLEGKFWCFNNCKTRFRSLAVLNGTREKVELVEVILSEMMEKNNVENIKIKGDLGVINKEYKLWNTSTRSHKKRIYNCKRAIRCYYQKI